MSTIFTLKAQWTSLNAHVPASNHKVWGMEVVGEDLIWGLTYNYLTFAKPEYLIKSLDGGATWTATPINIPEDQYSLHIFPLDENIAWLATTDEANPISGKIFKTTDGGQTWTEQTTAFAGFNETPAGVYFWNENEGVAFGATGLANYDNQISVYRTVDGGENWTKVVPPDFPAQLPHEGLWVYCDNGFFEVQGDNVWFVTNGPRIYHSTDRGMTWTAHDTGLTNAAGIAGIAFKDELNGIAVSYNPNAAVRTSDGGFTWEPLAIPSSPPAVDIVNVPGTFGTYVLHNATADWAGSSTLTLVTYDNGDTWETLSTGPNFDCMEFKSPTLGFAGGIISSTTSGIYRWDGGTLRKPVFVNDDATGANTGYNWADAFTDLQSALAISQEGDQIWVAEGNYLPGTDPTATFLINKNLQLYGGFAGTETTLAERGDPAGHPAILSGDVNGDDEPGNFVMHRDDNSSHAVSIAESANGTMLDGFIISGGNGKPTTPPASTDLSPERGGGITSLASCSIKNCIFRDNSAVWGGAGCYARFGDAVLIENCIFETNSAPRAALALGFHDDAQIVNCKFIDNKGSFGGAGAYLGNLNVVVRDCEFTNNQTPGGEGGAVFLWQNPQIEFQNPQMAIENCTFTNNQSLFGGGVSFNNFIPGGHLTIQDCTFENNSTSSDGGGLSVYNDNTTPELLALTLTDNHFKNNVSGGDGGGVWMYNLGESAIKSCTFVENGASSEGGGIFSIDSYYIVEECSIIENISNESGGGFFIQNFNPGVEVNINRSIITGNQSPDGAVIAADLGTGDNVKLSIENSLIAENGASNTAFSISSTPDFRLLNCTVADNASGAILLSGGSHLTLQNTVLANPGYTEFEDITEDATVTSTGGNLVLDNSLDAHLTALDKSGIDPGFMPGSFDPSSTSPLVNAGVNAGVTSPVDLAGNERIQQGIVDIGAFESPFLTAAREMVAGEAAVSPNPASTFLNIELPVTGTGNFEVRLFDTQGRAVSLQTITPSQPVDVKKLSPGFYMLKAAVGDRIYTGKFVKQ
jgi:photosystem II stability/assembly factor-like uncharacterized protein